MTTTNPFDFSQESSSTAKTGRRLDFTPQLIAHCNQKASELMLTVSKRPELYETAKAMQTGKDVQDLLNLINAVYDSETIKTDAAILDGCDDEQLARLLESRRSDRSKAKAKGLNQAGPCVAYISSMYAELLIREKMGKPYQGSSSVEEVDTDDADAIKRRIKSLQTKTCRLRKLAAYDPAAAQELADAEAEIARLNGYRPNSRVTGKTTIGGMDVAALREVLKTVDTSKLSEADLQKFNELSAKIG